MIENIATKLHKKHRFCNTRIDILAVFKDKCAVTYKMSEVLIMMIDKSLFLRKLSCK